MGMKVKTESMRCGRYLGDLAADASIPTRTGKRQVRNRRMPNQKLEQTRGSFLGCRESVGCVIIRRQWPPVRRWEKGT